MPAEGPVLAAVPVLNGTVVATNKNTLHARSEKDVSEKAQEPWSVPKALAQFSVKDESNVPPKSPIPFFHLLERLKTTPREGWRRFTIDHGESISDHMYRMSIITMLAPKSLSSRLNIPHCTKMALVHDMAESLVGDITPVDGVSKQEKGRREGETMDYLTKSLLGGIGNGGSESGDAIREIWQEYEDSKTLEAKFVHDVDKLELMLQMVEYEKKHGGMIDLGEFVWVSSRIELEEVQQWVVEILREREEFWKGKGKAVSGLELGRTVITKFSQEG